MPHKKLIPLALFLLTCLGACAKADEKVLYEKRSRYNHVMVTEDNQGMRTLMFEKNGVRQSVVKPGDPDHLELAYTRSMMVGLALVQEPQRILIVGVGGGTIPSFLHKHYPQARIDAVDIDPAVIEVARQYFGLREDRTLHTIAADGREFIEKCREPYDLIFLDAFGPDSIPYRLATREFLQAARRAVAPGGFVLGNVWSSESNSLYSSMVRTYQDVFADLYVQDVPDRGNRILIGLPRAQRIDREELAARAAKLVKQKQFRYDLGEIIQKGLKHPPVEEAGAHVLLDKDELK
jgi:spermidine synthase